MTLTLHRVAKLKYAGLPQLIEHGYGAARYGSRWNSPDEGLRFDRRIIFASDTLTQAMLEILVHVDADVLHSVEHGHVRFSVKEEFIAALDLETLPKTWNAHPPSAATQVIGDQWFDEKVSPLLRVPSAILPLTSYDEKHGNYLINAHHPKIEEAVQLVGVETLPMDPRLKK
jgi:RES domain-containing protein